MSKPDGSGGHEKPSLWTRARYRFDAILSHGTAGLLFLSLVGSALITLLLTPIFWFLEGITTGTWQFRNFAFIFWSGFVGLFKAGDGEGPWVIQLSNLAFAIVAIFFTGIVFGSVVRSIGKKFGSLREKGGPIVATDHTVIIGWSPLGFRILTELAIANENQGKCSVAILCPGSKVKLEESVADLPMKTTKIVVRKGKSTSLSDFDQVRLNAARNVIVLGEWDSEEHDSQVIATLLALARYREAHPEFDAEIVGCFKDEANRTPAIVAAKYPVTLFNVRVLLARVMLQVSRQPGLFAVFSEILQFDGDEIYYVREPRFVGKRFIELAQYYPDSTPIGLVRDGVPQLLPDLDAVIGEEDKIIFITEDDDTAIPGAAPAVGERGSISEPAALMAGHEGESWLFTDWAPTIPDVLTELDLYLMDAKNTVTIIVHPDDIGQAKLLDGLDFKNVEIELIQVPDELTTRAVLDDADVPGRTYVVIPSGPAEGASDMNTLLTLLHVRDIIDRNCDPDNEPFVVSELLSDKFRKIADESDVRDIVVSSELVSLLLVQLAENPGLLDLYQDLFDADGAEIYLKPAAYYVKQGATTSFMTIVDAANERGEIAIGYRLQAESGLKKKAFGVYVNPRKDEQVTLGEGDMVVVIATDEGMPAVRPNPSSVAGTVVSS